MNYQVWYWKPTQARHFLMGYKWLIEHRGQWGMDPRKANLYKTHTYVKNVEAEDLEDLYRKMQGEVWSPNGEARPLIKQLDLDHTSMSVGDVAVDEAGVAWMVDRFGFERLPAK